MRANNQKKDISVLGEGPTQGLDKTTLTAEDKYSINFTESGNRFMLSLHYNWTLSYLLIPQKYINSKQNILT